MALMALRPRPVGSTAPRPWAPRYGRGGCPRRRCAVAAKATVITVTRQCPLVSWKRASQLIRLPLLHLASRPGPLPSKLSAWRLQRPTCRRACLPKETFWDNLALLRAVVAVAVYIITWAPNLDATELGWSLSFHSACDTNY